MRQIVKSSWSLIAGLAALVAGERDAWAVGGGQAAGDADFGSVGLVSQGNSATCSAVLITPAWVLTAHHCVGPGNIKPNPDLSFDLCDSIGDFRGSTYSFTFGESAVPALCTPATATTTKCGLHSPAVSGLIKTPLNFVDLCSAQGPDANWDLALVQLDARVPTSLVPFTPVDALRPGGGNCASGTMTLVGYGPTSQGGSISNRNYFTSMDWEKSNGTASDFEYWSRGWISTTVEPFSYEPYRGGLPGDSGGGLFQNGLLCGIQSKYWAGIDYRDACLFGPVCLPGVTDIIPVPVVKSGAANVASDGAVAWMKESPIIDSYGEWMGACTKGDPAKRDIDTDNDLIPDACDPCPFVADPTYRQTGVYNAMFSADFDHDGVPDLCDNCPSRQNATEPGVPGNGQRDTDQDGLGDACDVCGATASPVNDVVCCNSFADCAHAGLSCFPLGKNPAPLGYPIAGQCAGFVGRCDLPRDEDGDTRPDNCDNCIFENQNDQLDTDGDGVGDACDECPGVHPDIAATGVPVDTSADQNPSICFPQQPTAHAQCIAATGDGRSRCIVVGALGHCSHWLDVDGDGIGNACDGCPYVNDPYDSNCNFHAELYSGATYPFRTDRCDPIPCTRTDYSAATVNLPPDGTEHRFQRVTESPRIIPFAQSDAFVNYTPNPTATVGHRFCECEVGVGTKADIVAKCHDAGCVVNGGQYTNAPNNPWKTPHLQPFVDGQPTPAQSSIPGAQFPAVPLTNANAPAGAVAGLPSAADPIRYDWDLTLDGAQLIPCGQPPCFNGYTLGASYWSAVRGVSGTNAAFLTQPHGIFERGNHYEAQSFGVPPNFLKVPQFECPFCWLFNCPTCNQHGIPDFSIRVNPPDLAVITPGGAERVATLPPSLVAAFQTPGIKYIAATDIWTAQADGDVRFGFLTPTNQPSYFARYTRTDGFTQYGRGPRDTPPPPSNGIVPNATSLAAAMGTLSASEASVLYLGGTEASPPLRTYDLRTQSWTERPLTGASVKTVLAATYSDRHRSVFVLDQTTVGGATKIRLVRVSLSYGTATVLGMWQKTGTFQSHFLTIAQDGSLVLASSSSNGIGKHLVARVTLDARGDNPVLDWAVADKGALTLAPYLTREILSRTLAKHGGTPAITWDWQSTLDKKHHGFDPAF